MRNKRSLVVLSIGLLLLVVTAVWLPGRPVTAQTTTVPATPPLLQDEQNTVDIVE